MYKPIRKKKSYRNLKTRFFQALKCSYFVSKVSRRHELAGDDVENCENSQLTFVSVSVEMLSK